MPLCKAPRVLNLFKAIRAIHWLGSIYPDVFKDIYFTRTIVTLTRIRGSFWVFKDVGHPNGESLLAELIDTMALHSAPTEVKGIVVGSLELNNESLNLDMYLVELEYQLRGMKEAFVIYGMEPSEAYAASIDIIRSLLLKYAFVQTTSNCATCMHMTDRGTEEQPGQHCYMFAEAPVGQCMQHTGLCSL